MTEIPEKTGWIQISFFYHKCEHGKRLVYNSTAPCNICINENKPQTTISMGHIMVRVDKEGFLKVLSPLRVRE